MKITNCLTSLCALMIAFCIVTQMPANAQVSGKAFEGFSGNNKDPIQIEADELEVIDSKSMAIFTGNVKVRQGPSLITTSKLVVHYAKDGQGGQDGQNDIDKLEMFGGVVVTSEENTVTADEGTYIVKTEDVVLTGNVVISQGANVAKGTKLVANMKTNKATLSGGKGGRVGTVITPGSQKPAKTKTN